MKVLLQWAQKNPQDWHQIDASEFASLPKKPVPTEVGGENNTLGLLADVMVQGVRFNGLDHIAVEPYVIGNDDGVRVTGWNDDAEDYPIGQRVARVWTFLPLAADANLGGAINTRQFQTVYAEGERYDKLLVNIPQNTTVRPWAEFVEPAASITRHGTWLTDAKWQEHLTARTPDWGWMHWVDHLPDSETETDPQGRRKLKEQRAQGRYHQVEHTITYYQRDTNRANPEQTASHEDALELTTAASATESITLDSGSVTAWTFTTDTNQPNSADWPSGSYRFQLNCTAASLGVSYCGTVLNEFRRTDSAISSLETWSNVESAFSGTGLKLATSSKDPAAGSASDRFYCVFAASGDSHGDAITLQLNTTDSYADGPWSTETTTADKWHPAPNQPYRNKIGVTAY